METQEDTTDKEKGMILVSSQDRYINYVSYYILYDLAVVLLQIIMVSPGTHLVKNHESQSRTIESQFKKKLHLWGYLYIRDAGRRGNKITVL